MDSRKPHLKLLVSGSINAGYVTRDAAAAYGRHRQICRHSNKRELGLFIHLKSHIGCVETPMIGEGRLAVNAASRPTG